MMNLNKIDDKRTELSKIASQLSTGDVDGLFSLRGMVVDLRLSREAAMIDDPILFLVIYLSKNIISDVWENLALDATFDLDLVKLQEFAIIFGKILNKLLLVKDENLNEYRLGETVKWLFNYFDDISENPVLVFKK